MVCGERPGRSEMEMEMEMEMVMVMGGRCVEECEGTRAGHRQRVRRAPLRCVRVDGGACRVESTNEPRRDGCLGARAGRGLGQH